MGPGLGHLQESNPPRRSKTQTNSSMQAFKSHDYRDSDQDLDRVPTSRQRTAGHLFRFNLAFASQSHKVRGFQVDSRLDRLPTEEEQGLSPQVRALWVTGE